MLLTLGLTSVAAFFVFFQRALHEDVRGTRSIEVTRLGSSIFGSPVYLCKTNETDCEFSRPYGVVTVLTLRQYKLRGSTVNSHIHAEQVPEAAGS